MFDYSRLASTAVRLLQEYGRELVFTRDVEGSYNPATGAHATTSTEYTKYAAAFDYRAFEVTGAVEVGDKRLICEEHAYEIGDTVSIDSVSYRVMDVMKKSPADTAVYYELRVRR